MEQAPGGGAPQSPVASVRCPVGLSGSPAFFSRRRSRPHRSSRVVVGVGWRSASAWVSFLFSIRRAAGSLGLSRFRLRRARARSLFRAGAAAFDLSIISVVLSTSLRQCQCFAFRCAHLTGVNALRQIRFARSSGPDILCYSLLPSLHHQHYFPSLPLPPPLLSLPSPDRFTFLCITLYQPFWRVAHTSLYSIHPSLTFFSSISIILSLCELPSKPFFAQHETATRCKQKIKQVRAHRNTA